MQRKLSVGLLTLALLGEGTSFVLGGGLLPIRTGGSVPQASAANRAAPEAAVEMVAAEPSTIKIDGNAAAAGSPQVQLINSRSLAIDFDVKGVGSSGVSATELWYTRNGQVWKKYPGLPQVNSPFLVNVSEDGMYGFTVVASNGVGLHKSGPQPGDPPQTWIEVDTIKPEVHLVGVHAGVDSAGRTLAIHWTATDKNIVARPVTLSYAEQSQGAWVPFAMNLENTGHYVWRMPTGLTGRVVVRVAVIDRVGNVAADETAMPAPIDLNRPEAAITRVGPNGVIQQTSQSR